MSREAELTAPTAVGSGAVLGIVRHLHHSVVVKMDKDWLTIDVMYHGDHADENIHVSRQQLPRLGSDRFRQMQSAHYWYPDENPEKPK